MSLFMISPHRGLGDDFIRYMQSPSWRQMGPIRKIKHSIQDAPVVPVVPDQSPKKRVYKHRVGLRSFQCDCCHNKFEKFMRMDARSLRYCPNCTQSVRATRRKDDRCVRS